MVRGWEAGEWRERVRRANLHLAVLICGVALFLALPILDFGAISARQQLARLDSGAVSAEDFDYDALHWDFGAAGRRALAKLARSSNAEVARLARTAQKQALRPYARTGSKAASEFDLRVQPANPVLEAMVRDYLRAKPWICSERCVALDLGPARDGGRKVALVNELNYEEIALPSGTEVVPELAHVPIRADSTVEVRTVQKRVIYVDGKPLPPSTRRLIGPLEASESSR